MSLERINALNSQIFERFSVRRGSRVHNLPFFISKTVLSPSRYDVRTASDMLARLGATHDEYTAQGVVLLRSVMMNPWHGMSKRKGRYLLCELVESLFEAAAQVIDGS
jgi:hypothetical protein